MKNIFKYTKRLFFSILILIVGYLLISIILSVIPANKNFREPLNSDYEIWIKSNGVHLDIVLPIKNKFTDWNDILLIPDNIKDKVQFVGFGWGDKEFYINTPEWSDLKFSIAFRALFKRTDAAMHVTYYKNITENDHSIKLLLNEQQFEDIQSFILKSFKINKSSVIPIKDIEYGTYDRFYDANYSYSLFYTCNTWTNEALKKAELPACVWTPFDKGILYQYRKFKKII